MSSATIKLYLPHGDPRRLRTAEISNWSGKAIAAPRTELDLLFSRPEIHQAGVYLLVGVSTETGRPAVYIGEAEVLGERLKQHRDKDFWSQVVVFFSKDENLTKAHIKFLEGRLIDQARKTQRAALENSQASGAKLPESDRADMEVFFEKIAQLLPVLGSEVLVPVDEYGPKGSPEDVLVYEVRDLKARGRRTESGFVVFEGSQAVEEERAHTQGRSRNIVSQREQLLAEGILKRAKGHLRFTRNVEFTSPSTAAGVISGGEVNGLIAWKDPHGKTLKEIEGA